MKLRISHVVVQPVLVWDDGEELKPGPQLGQLHLPLSALEGLAASLPGEVAALQSKMESGE